MKVVIIGGGVSGLTSGIYARRCGFETIILEKTVNMGGECTGWDRHGFHIDNSIHWLTGTKKDSSLYKVWCQVGALGPDIRTTPVDPFFTFDTPSGRTFKIHHDLEALRKEMYEFGPEDKEATDEFIRIIKGYQKMEFPADAPAELLGIGGKLKKLWGMRGVIAPHVKYRKHTISDYSKQFKSEDLRAVINAYFPHRYYAEALFDILAIITSGNGNLPEGGSLALTRRMEQLYLSLGGQLRTNAEVIRIEAAETPALPAAASAVILKSGERIEADRIISAVPVNVLLEKLLGNRFRDDYFDERLRTAPTFSNTIVYVGVKGDSRDVHDNGILRVAPFRVGRRKHTTMLFHHYDHEKGFAPDGHYVCQMMVNQYDADFAYWKALWDRDHAAYRAEKLRIANDMVESLAERFPALKGSTEILEVLTPMSFYKRCGSHHGSYMCFIRTPHFGEKNHCGRIEGLTNLYVSGQWGQPGGMPSAVTSGRFAVQRMCHDTGIPFIEE